MKGISTEGIPMPSQRTSLAPPKERARLDTAAQVQHELKRLYRRFSNGQLSADALKTRVAALSALRAGMSDPVAPSEDGLRFGIETLNLVSIPHNWLAVGLLGAD